MSSAATLPSDEIIIAQTKKWIVDVVVGCHFCPFAAREVKRNSIAFEVAPDLDAAAVLQLLRKALAHLDQHPDTETLFIILPHRFQSFRTYLQLVHTAEQLLRREKKEGIYQVASFHPNYVFAGSRADDPANYTNRSPYPMLHLLREESVSRAVDNYPQAEQIPERNVAFAREKGWQYMNALREACLVLRSEA
jgi:uncharacterized protein